MEDIIIRTKDVYTMEAKISKKIKEIGLVSTDISAVIDDCRALAIAICVGNTTLVCGAFEYLSDGAVQRGVIHSQRYRGGLYAHSILKVLFFT